MRGSLIHSDIEKTDYALRVHGYLIRQGYDPNSPAYWDELDWYMRCYSTQSEQMGQSFGMYGNSLEKMDAVVDLMIGILTGGGKT